MTGAVEAAATVYDRLLYPSHVLPHARPERLAVAAYLHGLTPAPPDTARMLDVGGGDGLNMLAFAAAHPAARGVSFDLAELPVARGAGWAARAGLTNASVVVGDIVTAAAEIKGQFDYIVVNGIYAWVPDAVRTAVMPLIAAKLASGGVAMVSFNAFPGAALRSRLRDLMLARLGDHPHDIARADAARALLETFAHDETHPPPLREQAKLLAARPANQLAHDELNPEYHPQHIAAVIADARAHGLAFLGDVGLSHIADGFLGSADNAQARIEARAAEQDRQRGTFFHSMLLVSQGAPIARTLDFARLALLFASTRMRRTDDHVYAVGARSVRIDSPVVAGFIDALIAAAPGRVRIADIADDPRLQGAAFTLFDSDMIALHFTADPPHAVRVAARPAVHPLARAMFACGEAHSCTLDHHGAAMDDRQSRRLIALMDGTRNRAALAKAARLLGATDTRALDAWLAGLLHNRLLSR